jgi:hypothetical protein
VESYISICLDMLNGSSVIHGAYQLKKRWGIAYYAK